MKSSEAFLLALYLDGGEITPEKVADRLRKLEQAGYLERVTYTDPERNIQWQSGERRLTEKAKKHLQAKGYAN